MIKRIRQLLLILFALFVTYLVVVRLLISWAQFAPDQFGSALESVTQSQIEFQNLNIEQNWSGVTVKAEDLLVEHKTFEVEAERLAVDLNLFAPFIPRASLGEFLEIRGLNLLKFSTGSALQKAPAAASAITMQSVEQFIRRLNISRLWKRVDIADLTLSIPYDGVPATLNIETFQAFKGASWTLASDLSLSYGSHLKKEHLQLKGSFLPNVWGAVEQGEFSLTSFQPLKLKNLARLLPEKWHQVLPSGELTVEVRGKLSKALLSDLNIDLYAQALGWPDNEEALPKTLGVDLEWKNQAQSYGQDGVNWLFSANRVQLDNQYIETVAPVELSLLSSHNLHFSTQKFNIKPFKKMIHAILKNENVAQLFEASVELSLENVEGDLDVETLITKNLSLEISKLSIPVTSLPGLALEKLYVDKRGDDFQIIVDKPFWVMEPRVHAVPMRFEMHEILRGKLNQSEGSWSLNPLKLQWDGIPVELVASGDFIGHLDARLYIEPSTLEKVKQYLPYKVMSEKLQTWLKSALVSGEGVEGELFFNGDLNDYPFVDGETKFGGVATVKNAHLKFQPNWPGLSGFDAKVSFSPYRLDIVSDEIQLEPGLLAKDVEVVVDQLETKNIAVNIKGSAGGDSDAVRAYLAETPLPAKIGVDNFLSDPEKLAMQGRVEVDLQKIWIPVYGYADQDEKVSGNVRFDNAQWKLFNQIAFNDINGELSFTEKSLKSNKLRAKFEGGAANIEISTAQNHKQIQINAAGIAHPEYPDVLKGTVDWRSSIKVPIGKGSKDGVIVDVDVDMGKAQWLMPAPLNNETLSGKAQVRLVVHDQKTNVTGSVDNLGVFALGFKTDGSAVKLVDGAVKIGGSDTSAVVSEKNKVATSGMLNEIDLDGWMKWKAPASSGKPSWLSGLVWAKSNLKAKSVLLFNQKYPSLDLAWQTVQEGQLAFNLSADYVQAVATLQGDEALDINVDRLRLTLPEDTFSEKTTDSVEAKRQLQQCKVKTPSLGTWPKVTFAGKEVVINDIAINRLSFQVEDNRDALHFKNLDAVFAKNAGVLSGQYFFHKGPKQSSAALKVSSADVKALTELLGLKQGFSGKRAELKANIAWSGGLECFDLLGLSGRTDFEVRDGVIEDVEPGFARLLGLLNVTSIARRLSLDLKDVTTKGMAYDNIKGKALFNGGKLNLDGFKLKAPSATVDLFGSVNLVKRDFDLKANVTPALGSSLPALTALTGVASPLGALAIYALMKVIPDINEDLVTYKYNVTGPWASPVIKEQGTNKKQEQRDETDDLLNRQ